MTFSVRTARVAGVVMLAVSGLVVAGCGMFSEDSDPGESVHARYGERVSWDEYDSAPDFRFDPAGAGDAPDVVVSFDEYQQLPDTARRTQRHYIPRTDHREEWFRAKIAEGCVPDDTDRDYVVCFEKLGDSGFRRAVIDELISTVNVPWVHESSKWSMALEWPLVDRVTGEMYRFLTQSRSSDPGGERLVPVKFDAALSMAEVVAAPGVPNVSLPDVEREPDSFWVRMGYLTCGHACYRYVEYQVANGQFYAVIHSSLENRSSSPASARGIYRFSGELREWVRVTPGVLTRSKDSSSGPAIHYKIAEDGCGLYYLLEDEGAYRLDACADD